MDRCQHCGNTTSDVQIGTCPADGENELMCLECRAIGEDTARNDIKNSVRLYSLTWTEDDKVRISVEWTLQGREKVFSFGVPASTVDVLARDGLKVELESQAKARLIAIYAQ